MIGRSLAKIAILAMAVLLGTSRAAHAAESYDNCTGFITSVPAVITAPGTWCLKQDLATAISSGIAITVDANNVTLDCNNFKLGGLAAGAGTNAVGIYADYRSNITVRRCNVRGFYDGLRLFDNGSSTTSSQGHAVEDNVFMSNTHLGLQVDGDGSVVRRNRVLQTGGSSELFAIGIITNGSVDTLDNTIAGVSAPYVYGIYTIANKDGSDAGNRVRGVASTGSGSAYGILIDSSSGVVMRNNDLIGSAASNSTGIVCNSLSGSSGHARDNVINGFASGMLNCGDNGGNVVAP